jgi:hypothetical protein
MEARRFALASGKLRDRLRQLRAEARLFVRARRRKLAFRSDRFRDYRKILRFFDSRRRQKTSFLFANMAMRRGRAHDANAARSHCQRGISFIAASFVAGPQISN